jgi:hypothetical protein
VSDQEALIRLVCAILSGNENISVLAAVKNAHIALLDINKRLDDGIEKKA